MKGVILAAGKGSRLLPSTKIVPKVLLPVYDKPMIFYAVEAMIDAGVKDIMIVASSIGEVLIAKTLEGEYDGKVNITYKAHDVQMGSVDAFRAAADFIRGDDCLLYFADNIFLGVDFKSLINKARDNLQVGFSSIITYTVPNPKGLGIVEHDSLGNIKSIEEKPEHPKSNYAAIGVYVYTKDVVDKMYEVEIGYRGEYEITDLNNIYLDLGKLKAINIKNGKWFDTGTKDAVLEAAKEAQKLNKESR